MRAQMGRHFVEALDLEDRVIAGDLAGARAAGAGLAAVVVAPGFPDLWRPWLADTKAAGEAAANAKDLPTAAAATAEAMLSCGECHSATGGGPHWDVPEAPSGPAMTVHRFGASWMGYGLITASDDAWTKGASALIASPIPTEGPGGLEVRVRGLAVQAKATTDPETRARLWAELLTTCATCHATAR